jgi:hypothetical protein
MIGRSGFPLWAKLSYNCDRRSTSCFKIFSSFQKVNSLVPGCSITQLSWFGINIFQFRRLSAGKKWIFHLWAFTERCIMHKGRVQLKDDPIRSRSIQSHENFLSSNKLKAAIQLMLTLRQSRAAVFSHSMCLIIF